MSDTQLHYHGGEMRPLVDLLKHGNIYYTCVDKVSPDEFQYGFPFKDHDTNMNVGINYRTKEYIDPTVFFAAVIEYLFFKKDSTPYDQQKDNEAFSKIVEKYKTAK